MVRDRILSLSKILVLVSGVPVSGALDYGLSIPALAQMADPIVTSDTPEYCDVLLQKITGLSRMNAMPPPIEAATLSEEGERMCVRGQTRGGILRLRRALAIMMHGED